VVRFYALTNWPGNVGVTLSNFSKTLYQAADQVKLAKLIWRLPPSTVSTLVSLIEEKPEP
jgi:hypothetical protein